MIPWLTRTPSTLPLEHAVPVINRETGRRGLVVVRNDDGAVGIRMNGEPGVEAWTAAELAEFGPVVDLSHPAGFSYAYGYARRQHGYSTWWPCELDEWVRLLIQRDIVHADRDALADCLFELEQRRAAA